MARPTPALLCASIPTITFSIAVMFANSRMFWNVRPIPCSVATCGGLPVMSASAKTTRPALGL